MSEGKIIAIRGVVVDIQFPEDQTPKIYDALVIETKELGKLMLEVEAILEPGLVRAVALDNVFGLRRSLKVQNTGHPIEVPVGEPTLGRIFNIQGELVDEGPAIKVRKYLPIHRTAPILVEQSVNQELFETGIKVIDLIAPFIKGGKVAIFGGAGVGERSREGNDLWNEMKETKVIDKTALVFGQMNEPPGNRLRVALTGVTMAE